MPKEIERKFLVVDDSWRKNAEGTVFRQGFLSTDKERVVRIRVAGSIGFITIKGIAQGVTRTEYEYEIPLHDAETMLNELCIRPFIEKTRFRIEYEGLVWEVDEFHGDNQGLIVAEVELQSEDQKFALPPWAGDEVSDNPKYFNSNLIHTPYSRW